MAAVMPVRRHVVVVPTLVSEAEAAPPIAERLTVTVPRLLLASVTVQVRTDAAEALAEMVSGVMVQAEMTGATLSCEIVREAELVSVEAALSVAVTVKE